MLRALLLQALYSVRSERLLMEQLYYNLLFRWSVGLNLDGTIWDVIVSTKNRERLLDGDIAEAFFQAVLQQVRERESALGSALHRGWNTNGSVGERAELSTQGCQERGSSGRSGQCDGDFHGEKLSNQTHASKTDPDAKMARKGKGKEAALTGRTRYPLMLPLPFGEGTVS